MYTLYVEAMQDLPNPAAVESSRARILIGTANDLAAVRMLTKVGRETLDHYRRAGFLARFDVEWRD